MKGHALDETPSGVRGESGTPPHEQRAHVAAPRRRPGQLPWSEVTRFLAALGHQVDLKDDAGNDYVVMTRERYEALQAAALNQGGVRRPAPRTLVLTGRERQCLHLVSQGLTTAEIARRLGLAQNTAAQHLAAARRRCGVSSSMAAVVVARAQGLVP